MDGKERASRREVWTQEGGGKTRDVSEEVGEKLWNHLKPSTFTLTHFSSFCAHVLPSVRHTFFLLALPSPAPFQDIVNEPSAPDPEEHRRPSGCAPSQVVHFCVLELTRLSAVLRLCSCMPHLSVSTSWARATSYSVCHQCLKYLSSEHESRCGRQETIRGSG